MQSYLETAAEKADIILFQESWIFKEYTIVSHSSFQSIMSSESGLRSRVCAFIAWKSAELFTSRLDLCQDSNIQAIAVFKSGLPSMLILNIYNERSKADFSFWRVNRVLKNI